MNSKSSGKQHRPFGLGLSWPKLPSAKNTGSTCKRRLKFTRRFSGGTRRLGISPGAARIWRLMARGTEPGHPAGLLVYWPRWEHLAHQIWPTTGIPGAPYGLLEMRIGPYKGKPLTLPDKTEIREGTLVGELHCNNEAILNLVSRHEISPFSACREDLRSMAAWARQSDLGEKVAAFFGVTILAQGAARLGFKVCGRRLGIRGRLDRLFMTGLLLLYGKDGLDRLGKGTTLCSYPQQVWMSRRELLRRYGDGAAHRVVRLRDARKAGSDFARKDQQVLPTQE